MVCAGCTSICTHACPLCLLPQDKQVLLWDLRTNICQGRLTVPGSPMAVFDQQVGGPGTWGRRGRGAGVRAPWAAKLMGHATGDINYGTNSGTNSPCHIS